MEQWKHKKEDRTG